MRAAWLVGFALAVSGAHAGSLIEAFGDTQSFPAFRGLETLPPGTVTVYDLSLPRRLTHELSEGLPADPAQAETLARARLTDGVLGQLRAAYAGHARAVERRIDRVPAIVFDGGTAVVYGMTDVPAALERYRAWREAQP